MIKMDGRLSPAGLASGAVYMPESNVISAEGSISSPPTHNVSSRTPSLHALVLPGQPCDVYMKIV